MHSLYIRCKQTNALDSHFYEMVEVSAEINTLAKRYKWRRFCFLLHHHFLWKTHHVLHLGYCWDIVINTIHLNSTPCLSLLQNGMEMEISFICIEFFPLSQSKTQVLVFRDMKRKKLIYSTIF